LRGVSNHEALARHVQSACPHPSPPPQAGEGARRQCGPTEPHLIMVYGAVDGGATLAVTSGNSGETSRRIFFRLQVSPSAAFPR
jgi:hypothetical protein